MKHLVILSLVLLFYGPVFSQPCAHEGKGFYTQEQVDHFPKDYPNCKEIQGDVIISGDDITNLDSLRGLEDLKSIGGLLQLNDNHNLKSLRELGNLKTIGDDLYIYSNPSLSTLHGLDSINAGTIYRLYIYDNDSLSICDVLSICRYFKLPHSNVTIYTNAKGCDSQAEVQSGCDTLAVPAFTSGSGIRVYPNPTHDRIRVETSDPLPRITLVVINPGGEEVLSLTISKSSTDIDISNLPSGVYCLRLIGRTTVETRKILKD